MTAAGELPGFPAGPGPLDVAVAATGVVLRRARRRDLPFLREVHAASRAAELAAVPWPAAMLAAFLDDQFALQHRAWVGGYPAAEYLIVQRRGEPIGRCYVDFEPDATRGGDALLIDIALVPAERDQGIGSAVLAGLLRHGDRRGQAMQLHVLHANPGALRLYRRAGFVIEDDDGVRLHMRRPPRPAAQGTPEPARPRYGLS